MTATGSVGKTADMLAYRSRPRNHFTWSPEQRGWPYVTGAFQDHDLDDDPRSRTAGYWEDPDVRNSGRTRICRRRLTRDDTGRKAGYENVTLTASRWKGRHDTSVLTSATPESGTPEKRKILKQAPSKWTSLTTYQAVTEDGLTRYEPTGVQVRLCFTGQNTTRLLQIGGKEEPPTARFKRGTRVDETRVFDAGPVRSKPHNNDIGARDYGPKYQWFANATPIDALFPPGVPLTAKEILAFYPHHVRWKGAMLRLTSNDFRGADILAMQMFFRGPPSRPVTVEDMNNYQRDAVKNTLPDFRTADYRGTPDSNLSTDDLARGKTIEDMCRGYTLPTFDDLLRGLQHMPTGLNARGLTQCLNWYADMRDTFSPTLEMNVLHAQALISALRQPLEPLGTRNLDRYALQEWREKGWFEEARVARRLPVCGVEEKESEVDRPQLLMDLDRQNVLLRHRLPLRHVFTFPFLAVHEVVGEALRMGIRKAEARRVEREREEVNAARRQGADPESHIAQLVEEKQYAAAEHEEHTAPARPAAPQDPDSHPISLDAMTRNRVRRHSPEQPVIQRMHTVPGAALPPRPARPPLVTRLYPEPDSIHRHRDRYIPSQRYSIPPYHRPQDQGAEYERRFYTSFPSSRGDVAPRRRQVWGNDRREYNVFPSMSPQWTAYGRDQQVRDRYAWEDGRRYWSDARR
ncbi:hypothetical protein ACN47E_007487 [Coniothyrium glycines]